MSNYSKTILLGRLGQDPDVHTFDSGDKVAKLSLATSTVYYKDKEKRESVEWHNVVIKGNAADVVERYVKKGNLLLVDGKNKTRSYEKDGHTFYMTEVVSYSVQLMPTTEKSSDVRPKDGTESSQKTEYKSEPDEFQDAPPPTEKDIPF